MNLPLADVFTLLSHATTKLTASRRNKIARAIPKQYAAVRKTALPESAYLFGDDVDAVLASAKKQSYDQPKAAKSGYAKTKSYAKSTKSKNGKGGGKWSTRRKKKGPKKDQDKDLEQDQSA